ncbi:MAG: hypothetical protein ACTHJ0_01320 [Flavipsychrobacter sp.]
MKLTNSKMPVASKTYRVTFLISLTNIDTISISKLIGMPNKPTIPRVSASALIVSVFSIINVIK